MKPPRLASSLAVIGFLVFFAVPFVALVQRAPWSDFGRHLVDDDASTALRLSLVVSVAATALSLAFGAPMAWVLARSSLPARSLVRSIALLPLVLPPVVGGVALLFAFGRRGLVGQYLDKWFGVSIAFTTWAAIIAATFVAMPFMVVTLEGALRSVDTRYEEAAATLGAGRWTVLRRVTLPAVKPSLAAGAALTWARALGEFGATITFAGNLRGETQTLPLAVYLELQRDPGVALTLSLVMVGVSIVVLVAVGRRVWSR